MTWKPSSLKLFHYFNQAIKLYLIVINNNTIMKDSQ